jgi:hypothetical protein
VLGIDVALFLVLFGQIGGAGAVVFLLGLALIVYGLARAAWRGAARIVRKR